MQVETKTLSRRERERLTRRREILQAAKAVFAEKGYTHATLDEIAQRAEFGKGTLYNYFAGGKEDILFAAFDEVYDELEDLVAETFTPELAAKKPLRDVFEQFIVAHMNFFLERKELFMLIVKEGYRMTFSDDQGRATYFQHKRERMVNSLVPTLEAAMQNGDMKPLPVHAVAHMLMGNINGLQMHLALVDKHPACGGSTLHSPKEAADFLTTMMCDGLLAQPRS
ncbi:MAG TPA: TetR/AcrR family transcriptional regulator [Rhodothermales bacterium]|nr:TetR/AcrR family transcriptional regulator [Rhodothermales bacterium]